MRCHMTYCYTATTTTTASILTPAPPVTTTLTRYRQRDAHEAFFRPTQQQRPQHRCKRKTRPKATALTRTTYTGMQRQEWTREHYALNHQFPAIMGHHRPQHDELDTCSHQHDHTPTVHSLPTTPPGQKQHRLPTGIRLTGLVLHCFLFISFRSLILLSIIFLNKPVFRFQIQIHEINLFMINKFRHLLLWCDNIL